MLASCRIAMKGSTLNQKREKGSMGKKNEKHWSMAMAIEIFLNLLLLRYRAVQKIFNGHKIARKRAYKH